MKPIIFVVVIMFSMLVRANEIVRVSPADHTCAEMQGILKANGDIQTQGFLGFYDDHYLSGNQCPPLNRPNLSYVGSADQAYCPMGFVCVLHP